MEDGWEVDVETRRKVLAVVQATVERPGLQQAGGAKGGAGGRTARNYRCTGSGTQGTGAAKEGSRKSDLDNGMQGYFPGPGRACWGEKCE